MRRMNYLSIIFLIGVISLASSTSVLAEDASDQFNAVWSQTDRLVQNGAVSRSWIWGAALAGAPVTEPYVSAPGGQRTVRYYDKARMEIATANLPAGDEWRVTNGLLVTEMISGRVQLGDDTFADFKPAQINVAGDLDDPTGPTYAAFSLVAGSDPMPTGTVITSTIDRAGSVGTNEQMAQFGVTAESYVSTTNHTVASVFWAFMNQSGLVYQDNTETTGLLFANPFYATGLPVSEAYWTHVRVGGTMKNVLVQAFERRVLTFTPDNPQGWQVETGNVGLQYYTWRYQSIPVLCAANNASGQAARPEGCNLLSGTSSSGSAGQGSQNVEQTNSSTVVRPGSTPTSSITKQSNSTSENQNGSSSSKLTCSTSDTSSSETTTNSSQNVEQTNSSNIVQKGGAENCISVDQTNSSN